MKLEIIQQASPRIYPPRVTEFTAPFWKGLESGAFRTTRCSSCHKPSFPPKPICPHCWKDEVIWEDLPPEGVLYSWTRIHAGPAIFKSELPYAVGVVDLDVGVRLACRLYSATTEEWRCGMDVRLVALAHPDGPLFAATPR